MDIIIKGFIIGIGKVIPGVSGMALAISLGIYEQILESISNIKKEIKNKSTFLIKLGTGIILAIMLTSKVIVKCLKIYYLPTMLLFIGMITGGIPTIIKESKLNKNHIIPTLLITILLILISMQTPKITNHTLNYNIIEIIKLIGVGIIDSASSIIPGISGTALLMMIGYYNIILNSFSTLLDINNIKTNIFIMIPFTFGFIFGTITISKIITHLLNKHRAPTYIAIISFSILSLVLLIKNINIIDIIKHIPILIIGYIISRKLDK